MRNKIKVTITKNNRGTYEGLVAMPNLVPTRLRKDDGTTGYRTLSNLKQAASVVARKYNADLTLVDLNRVAAKKTAR